VSVRASRQGGQLTGWSARAGWLAPVLQRHATELFSSETLHWSLVGVGMLLRSIDYLRNRSLSSDSAVLAMNIIEGSFSDLVQPLLRRQAAPTGFLFLEKLSVTVLGESEYALRLVPLLASLASMFLFYRLAKRCLRPVWVSFVLALFAVGGWLIHYSSQVKQYSTDVAVALLIVVVAIKVESLNKSPSRSICYGCLGAIAVWFSHPSIFVLAGVEIVLLSKYLWQRDWNGAVWRAVPCSLWGLSFAASYVLILRDSSNSEYLQRWWNSTSAFMPWSGEAFLWLARTIASAFEVPAGLHFVRLAGLLFVVGCAVAVYRPSPAPLLVLSAVPFALIASVIHKYPFQDRLLLFIVPSLLVLVGLALEAISQRTELLASLLAVTLLLHPLIGSLRGPPILEDVKPVLSYIRGNWREGDALFVYRGARRAFSYYGSRFGFQESDLHRASDDAENLLKRQRVWIMYSNTFTEAAEIQSFFEGLNAGAVKTDSFAGVGFEAWVYEVKPSARSIPSGTREAPPQAALLAFLSQLPSSRSCALAVN